MPDSAEGRERLARLETQQAITTKELEDIRAEFRYGLRDVTDAMKELTAALNQVRGGKAVFITLACWAAAATAAVTGAAWAVYTWWKGN